ncbi:hypothetical protein ABBQ32_005770 [Trebouxia sp. C0010 RCD-2024]
MYLPTDNIPAATPANESIPPVSDSVTPVFTIKQEHPRRPIRHKRVFKRTEAEVTVFVVKTGKLVRKDSHGDCKVKLGPKAIGPCLLKCFRVHDDTPEVAIIADANDMTRT